MSRGQAQVIRDPAVAVAAGKCWLSRWGDLKIGVEITSDSFHPKECVFCAYDMRFLVESIDEFMDWSGLRPTKDPTPLRAEVEGFLTLSPEEQARAVWDVQYE
jgi:hypothetical protein